MKKLLILAANHHKFMNFCRMFQLQPYVEARYVRDWWDVASYWTDQPVILLEGYECNRIYNVGLLRDIGRRFENISFISEGELWNEGS